MGKLLVLEGVDGIGKTTLAKRLVQNIPDAVYYAFPGHEPGTIGKVVYDIHHDPGRFGLESILPETRQLLHIVAHIESIRTRIKPWLQEGRTVVLDRYWWSTWVYGQVYGVSRDFLEDIIFLEIAQGWGYTVPDLVVLVDRLKPFREASTDWKQLRNCYWDEFINREFFKGGVPDRLVYPIRHFPVPDDEVIAYRDFMALVDPYLC